MPKTKTLELRLRPKARRDLAGIWTYTRRRWSRAQADRYVGAIYAEIEELRERPSLGRPAPIGKAPFLKRACGSHVIFYLVSENTLDVVRVLHERMDFPARLANDET
jgi:toxin ParE1/3/4